ncbi:hypothetical protein AAIH70_11730 [Neorhizobium sp. BT27B]|uniref:hypothetical protein n=1 Tax=Neorhizobium sp. BT27B TaxID=3142625 RepID=UPI003D284EFE
MKAWTLMVVTVIAAAPANAAESYLNPSPRIIDRCEKDLARIVLTASERRSTEIATRFDAIAVVNCEEYGLVSTAQKSAIKAGGILQPYMDAYKENPDIWRRKP